MLLAPSESSSAPTPESSPPVGASTALTSRKQPAPPAEPATSTCRRSSPATPCDSAGLP